VVVIVVVVVVLVILLALVAVTARRRVAEAKRLNAMEEAGGTYLAPTGTASSGTMAGLASMRRDKTLRSSNTASGADYDEAPRAGANAAARAPDSFLEGKVLIPSDELVREAKIGEGAFGLVFKGTWGEKAVAIKEVKGASVEAIKQLVDEGDRLSQIPPHANVVTFFGVCAEPMGVVLQFCAKGALLDKLYGSDSSKFYEFGLAELQALVLGIADGLKHLHSVQVIHRDVATRNVLIDESGAPKLTDFGMSRDQEDGAEYVQQTKTSTGPLKWMAPEQMVDRIVSSKADMYSFGIVLWEMYARSEPWPGVAALQAAGNVMAGKQHAIAGEATPMAAAIMLACFDKDPHARPSAERVVKGGAAVWGADGSKVDGDAVGADAKENADVLKLKETHFAELPKEEDDAVYLAPPTSATLQAKKGGADLPKSSSSHRRSKKSGGGRTPRTPRADAN
jgi:proto-oncogene tyrosine-protein kinase Ret